MLKKVLGCMVIAVLLATPALALAQEKSKIDPENPQQAEALKHSADEGPKKFLGLALAFGLALAAFGGALGQSRAISAAVEAVARQPEAGGRIQGMMIIGLALIETLVIYMLLICFMFAGKLDPILKTPL